VSRRTLPVSFYRRPATQVAPDLLGRTLVARLPDGRRLSARLVETEAYRRDDPASHSFRGPTARTATMFGPPGRLYVYFTYGMHHCANVVTGEPGAGEAVLLRAAEPLEGIEEMAARRGGRPPAELLSGPGKLTQALGLDRSLDGAPLDGRSQLRIEAGSPVAADQVVAGPRIGVSVATEMPWRFSVRGDPWVSRPRPRA
jgi:DNA-3-methyladenine glycosylase